jgi:hypothetical protein
MESISTAHFGIESTGKECAVTKASFIGFFAAMCIVYAASLPAEEAVTVTAVPGNPGGPTQN